MNTDIEKSEAEGGFFDLGLSDIFGAYISVERDKARYSFDATQQGLAQKAAIRDAEKQTQNAKTADVTNPERRVIDGVNDKFLYVGGAVLVTALVLFAVLK